MLLCLLAGSLFFVANYHILRTRKLCEKAYKLCLHGEFSDASFVLKKAVQISYKRGRILSLYGDIFYSHFKNIENPTLNEIYSLSMSINLYEEAIVTYPSPFIFENLGNAYAYMALPQVWNITTNLSLYKTKDKVDLLQSAILYWKKASYILPWRLTPKYYLADLFYQLGNTNKAIKYARLVVNTPMKKWTERGKEFKLKSQKMLIALGEECDDPGLVVFDINEKKTWNEGLW